MKLCPRPLRIAAPLLALVPGLSLAQAPSPSPSLPPLVVTATRVAQPLTDVVADVTVIDRETIERSGAAALADVLARVPGVAFARNGGPAAVTSVYLRGAETRFTPVFIDGVRIDSQATGGATWNAIPLSQVERIEVVRGPAAAVYGSDALAGVVQIFTRRGEGPPTPSVRVGVGSYGTRDAEAALRGRSGAVDYAIALGAERSTGFNAQPAANPDKDGYRRESASASLGWRASDVHRFELAGLASDLDAQYDGFMPGQDDHAHHALRSLGLTWAAAWTDRYSTRLSATRGTERFETSPSPYRTETRVDGLLLLNEWRQGPHHFTAALERREDHLENASTVPPLTERAQNAVALGWGWRQGAHTLQLNARHDQDSEFGGHSTGGIAYAHELTPAWRVSGSVGTAFRAPTLFQRFSIYGVPTLRPETALNRELGLRWARGASSFGVVAYRNDVDDLITFITDLSQCPPGVVSTFGCYGNTGRARLSGVTFSAAHRVGRLALAGSLDLQDPRDLQTDTVLPRRPRRFATLAADTVVGRWTTGAELQLAGERFDNAANTRRLPGYGLVNLHASTPLGRDWRLLARVDNLADKAYETALGYRMPGRTAHLALQWEPR